MEDKDKEYISDIFLYSGLAFCLLAIGLGILSYDAVGFHSLFTGISLIVAGFICIR